MDLMQLKQQLAENSIPSEFMIFLCDASLPEDVAKSRRFDTYTQKPADDGRWLAKQYVQNISQLKNCAINYVDSIYAPLNSCTFGFLDTLPHLHVVITDTFEEKSDNYDKFVDTIVICNKIDKKLSAVLTDYIIHIPMLTDWQIDSYVRAKCPGIDSATSMEFIARANSNINVIDNDLDKVCLFAEQEQLPILRQIMDNYMPTLTAFKYIDFMKNFDIPKVKLYYPCIPTSDIEPIGFTTLLLRQFRNIVLARPEAKCTYQDLGFKSNYIFNKDRLNYSSYDIQRMANIIEFLAGIDLKLKSSEFDLPKWSQLDYIITKTLILGQF